MDNEHVQISIERYENYRQLEKGLNDHHVIEIYGQGSFNRPYSTYWVRDISVLNQEMLASNKSQKDELVEQQKEINKLQITIKILKTQIEQLKNPIEPKGKRKLRLMWVYEK